MAIHQPSTLGEACGLMATHNGPSGGDRATLVPIAGGTDLYTHWPQRPSEHGKSYLDLSTIEELRGVTWSEDSLTLGALATYWQLIQDRTCWSALPMLVQAARQIGAVQIQTRGTWAGNIANASPAADGVPVLMAYDAVVELVSSGDSSEDTGNTGDTSSTLRREEIPLAEFYSGYKQMRMRPDQLIRSIRIPRRPILYQRFEKVGSRSAQAITKVGVAIARSAAGWRVVANSVAPTVCRCRTVETLLTDKVPVRAPEDLAEALAQDIAPIDDIRSTAQYRRRVLARLLYFALRDSCPSFE